MVMASYELAHAANLNHLRSLVHYLALSGARIFPNFQPPTNTPINALTYTRSHTRARVAVDKHAHFSEIGGVTIWRICYTHTHTHADCSVGYSQA